MAIFASLDEVELFPHVEREKTDNAPHALGLPLSDGDQCQVWERIKATSRKPIAADSWQVIPAVIDTVREQVAPSWFSEFFKRWRRDDPAVETVLIPNGSTGTRIRPKRRDAILVISDGPTEINVDNLRSHWPVAERFEQLGRNLWLVVGVVVSRDE